MIKAQGNELGRPLLIKVAPLLSEVAYQVLARRHPYFSHGAGSSKNIEQNEIPA
jgi:hypothetical protein